jgi:ribosomal-protein-alanine N-acetyltransferase
MAQLAGPGQPGLKLRHLHEDCAQPRGKPASPALPRHAHRSPKAVVLALPVVRLAAAVDAGSIAQMSRVDIEHGLGWSWTEARVLQAIRDQAINVAVLAQGEGILGFGIMQYREESAHLALFAIRATHRNKGLGSLLMSWLEKPAAIAGVHRIGLEARADNPAAIAFYQKHGFAEVARVAGYYQGVVDAVRLEKQLGPKPGM